MLRSEENFKAIYFLIETTKLGPIVPQYLPIEKSVTEIPLYISRQSQQLSVEKSFIFNYILCPDSTLIFQMHIKSSV
jgi:hypothetical protein